MKRWRAMQFPVVGSVVAAAIVSWACLGVAPPAAAATTVASLSVTMSSPAAGAHFVEYAVAFDTSSRGALAGGAGTITVSGRRGIFSRSGSAMTSFNFIVRDETSGWVGYPGSVAVVANKSSATLTLAASQSVSDGDSVEVAVYGVYNPTTPGRESLSLHTSADTARASTGFTILANQKVRDPTASLSSGAAGATAVEYSIDFTASSTGGLATDLYNGTLGGWVILNGPAGLFAPGGSAMSSYNFVVTDRTSGTIDYPAAVVVSANGSSARLTLGLSQAVSGGDSVEVDIYGVTNPSASARYSIWLSTSSDGWARAGFEIVAAHRVTHPKVTLSSSSAGATGVDYSVSFDASDTGGLAPYGFVGPMNGTITLAAPTGTVFSATTGHYTITDQTTGSSLAPGTVSAGSHGSSVTLTLSGNQRVDPLDTVQVDATGVTNTTSVCTQNLVVSTSSDTVAAKASLDITGKPAAPAGVSSAVGNSEVSLSWAKPCSGGSPITDYVVNEYRGAAPTGTPSVIDTHGRENPLRRRRPYPGTDLLLHRVHGEQVGKWCRVRIGIGDRRHGSWFLPPSNGDADEPGRVALVAGAETRRVLPFDRISDKRVPRSDCHRPACDDDHDRIHGANLHDQRALRRPGVHVHHPGVESRGRRTPVGSGSGNAHHRAGGGARKPHRRSPRLNQQAVTPQRCRRQEGSVCSRRSRDGTN